VDSDAQEGQVQDIQAEISSFLNSLERIRTSLDALIPEAIVDHVPILYSTYIWNNIP
jgi:hypothetical protein